MGGVESARAAGLDTSGGDISFHTTACDALDYEPSRSAATGNAVVTGEHVAECYADESHEFTVDEATVLRR